MATRGQKIKVGVFLFIGLLLIAAALVIVTGVKSYQTNDYYVMFQESVTGLEKGGEVRYWGVPVGDVKNIEIGSFEEGGEVKVTLSIMDEFTPTKSMKARLGLRGITGVIYVEITGGGSAEALPPGSKITYEESLIENVTTDFPRMLAELREMLTKTNEALGDDPAALKRKIESVLTCFQESSTSFEDSMAQITSQTHSVTENTNILLKNLNTTITDMNSSATLVMATIKQTLETADVKMTEFDVEALNREFIRIADQVTSASKTMNTFLTSSQGGLDNVEYNLIKNLRQLESTLSSAENLLQSLERNPTMLLYGHNPPARPKEESQR